MLRLTVRLCYVVPSDLGPHIVSSVALPSGMCVCVYIMLAGVDITDAHYGLCMRPAFM